MIKLKPSERIKVRVRKHWFILLEHIAALLLVLFLPFVLYAFIGGTDTSLGSSQTTSFTLAPDLFLFLAAGWMLLIWMKLAGIWTDFHLDVWVVTNRRIVNVEQMGFFHREISTLQVEKIQDITVEVKGIFATIFDFGNIHVQTAAESREFSIHGVPHPRKIKEVILKQHDIVIEKEDNE